MCACVRERKKERKRLVNTFGKRNDFFLIHTYILYIKLATSERVLISFRRLDENSSSIFPFNYFFRHTTHKKKKKKRTRTTKHVFDRGTTQKKKNNKYFKRRTVAIYLLILFFSFTFDIVHKNTRCLLFASVDLPCLVVAFHFRDFHFQNSFSRFRFALRRPASNSPGGP